LQATTNAAKNGSSLSKNKEDEDIAKGKLLVTALCLTCALGHCAKMPRSKKLHFILLHGIESNGSAG